MTAVQILIGLITKRSMTQGQLSVLSNVPRSTISGIINENKTPNLKTAVKLADALGVNAEDLLTEKEVTK